MKKLLTILLSFFISITFGLQEIVLGRRFSISFLIGPLSFVAISCNSGKGIDTHLVAINYNDHIRPILNNKCIACHGGVKKLAGVSFLFEEEALSVSKNGNRIIIPGDAANSELIARVTHHDPNERMPMDEDPLTKEEIDILTRWIDQGAQWKDHWAFIPPEKKLPPAAEDEAWIKNAIDQFILARMDDEGLKPSEEADKPTLLRRVSLDLIGLPPSVQDRELFFNDNSPNAYDKLVDRLLASPRYGEHWTSMWLDLARYADSKGYEQDAHREIWKYRDWLIDAFNADMTFDEFTIQQLAGDLLPDASKDQIIATAFHRNTMNNDEGGTDDEEFRVAAVIDRVNTTWEVWQGISFGCVQCHSHPFDAFRHEEYYKYLSFFNNTADADLPTEEPVIDVYTKEEESKIALIKAWISENKGKPLMGAQLSKKETELDSIKGTSLPIMKELTGDDRRETNMFIRGNWLDKGKKVVSDVPASLPSLKTEEEPDRLVLAKWLVSGENPFTARVIANRIWAKLFGRGIVETLEDFGSQGSPPTHPEMLDWLALQFQDELGWRMKPLIKMMVTSATYKQSSKVTPEKFDKDPNNYLLSRASRIRLSAEQVRDQSLSVSGLLSEKMYGPSVKPYQPEGVWQVIYSGVNWENSEGEDAYRRGLYTYWRRTSPYPSMMSFDSPSREFCVNRRINTNTPLQALITLNDPVYIEAANALGNLTKRNGKTLDQRITNMFERTLLREPTEGEVEILKNVYVEASLNLAEDYDKTPMNLSLEALRTPMAVVANSLLNLDEFLTRQ